MQQTDRPVQLLAARPRAITWRSVALGLLWVLVISILTPYNDYVLSNTPFLGNNIPVGLLLMAFVFAVFINGPLSRFRPRWAFSTGEIVVAFGMALVACAVPASGVMRYLPASLIGPFSHASNPEYYGILNELHLPPWLLPKMPETLDERLADPVVMGYIKRLLPEETVPFAKWIIPMAAWGVFFLALFIALLCIVTLVRRQWVENERLPFPLAQIQLSLVMQPQPNRWFNALLARRSFWVAFGLVFFIHGWNGLAEYWPRYFPIVPTSYDMKSLMTEYPWSVTEPPFRKNSIYFTAIGVAYFVSGSVNFSLWFFFLFDQALRPMLQMTGSTGDIPGRAQEVIGGSIAFMLAMLWVGRHHWKLILMQSFRGHRPGEPRGRYLPYPFAFWTLMASTLVMIGWLMMAGLSWPAAVVTVLIVLFAYVFVARIIAETGLVHASTELHVTRPWHYLGLAGVTNPITVQEHYLVALVQMQNSDVRECLTVYGTHATRVADETIFSAGMRQDSDADRRTGRRFIALMLLSLVIAYVASAASMLWIEYRMELSLNQNPSLINSKGMNQAPTVQVLDPTKRYQNQRYNTTYSVPGHLGLGFVVTGVLSILRWQFTWWPLHPVGFIMRGSLPVKNFWASILIAWVLKTLILRFGGAKLYQACKPFFLGLIIGEAMAAGFWLVMAIWLGAAGIPFRSIDVLPA